jgi:predicted protein tyrosine phosphatase
MLAEMELLELETTLPLLTEKQVLIAHHKALQKLRQQVEVVVDREKSPAFTTAVLSLNKARDDLIYLVQKSSAEEANDYNNDGMGSAQEVYPRVFLGPFKVARSLESLRTLGITHVLSVAAEGEPQFCTEGTGIVYLQHPIIEVDCQLHNGAAMLKDILPSCAQFVTDAIIQEENNNNAVLIHCLHGNTRSAVVASYCRALLAGETFLQAYEVIRQVRDVFIPPEWLSTFEALPSLQR